MHKLDAPKEPEIWQAAVASHTTDYPKYGDKTEGERWTAFCSQHREAYAAAKEALSKEQRHTCAYCEISTIKNNYQIEHYIPKSTISADTDYTFLFSNFLLCCRGGANEHCKERGSYDENPNAKANHSCGDHKGATDPNNCCLNPYDLPSFSIFKAALTLDGIALAPDKSACKRAGIPTQLVESTCKLLNLNCPRLCRIRKQTWDEIKQQIDATTTEDDLKKLVAKNLRKNIPFFTTALLCLSDEDPDLIPKSLR